MMPVLRAGDLLIPARVGVVGTGRLTIAADQRFMWKARRVLQEFKMGPRLTVSYVREAFVSEDLALRITFDDTYRAAPIDPGACSPTTIPPGGIPQIIAEIKFVGALPAWLAELLAGHDLPQGGMQFSKFRQGVALSYPYIAGSYTEGVRNGEAG